MKKFLKTGQKRAIFRRFAGRRQIISAAVVSFADDFDADFVRFFPDLELIDQHAESVVVGSNRLKRLPNDLVAFVVVERFRRVDVFGDDYRNKDVTKFFARRAAHYAPNRLNHVDLRSARGEEKRGVKIGHVDAFRQTADVRKNAAKILIGVVAQPAQELFPLVGGKSSVDMPYFGSVRRGGVGRKSGFRDAFGIDAFFFGV